MDEVAARRFRNTPSCKDASFSDLLAFAGSEIAKDPNVAHVVIVVVSSDEEGTIVDIHQAGSFDTYQTVGALEHAKLLQIQGE